MSVAFSLLSVQLLRGKQIHVSGAGALDRFLLIEEALSVGRVAISNAVRITSPLMLRSVKLPYEMSMEVGPRRYKVRLEAEDGRLPVRYPSFKPLFLKRLLLGLGFTEEEARIVSDSLADFQDPDELRRPNGAESDYYRKLGYNAPNKPLRSLQEIVWVRGIDYEMYKKISDFVSVYTGNVNVNFAPEEVLKALGFSDDEVRLLLRARQRGAITFSLLRQILGNRFNILINYLSLVPTPSLYRLKVEEERTGERFTLIIDQNGEVVDALWY